MKIPGGHLADVIYALKTAVDDVEDEEVFDVESVVDAFVKVLDHHPEESVKKLSKAWLLELEKKDGNRIVSAEDIGSDALVGGRYRVRITSDLVLPCRPDAFLADPTRTKISWGSSLELREYPGKDADG